MPYENQSSPNRLVNVFLKNYKIIKYKYIVKIWWHHHHTISIVENELWDIKPHTIHDFIQAIWFLGLQIWSILVFRVVGIFNTTFGPLCFSFYFSLLFSYSVALSMGVHLLSSLDVPFPSYYAFSSCQVVFITHHHTSWLFSIFSVALFIFSIIYCHYLRVLACPIANHSHCILCHQFWRLNMQHQWVMCQC